VTCLRIIAAGRQESAAILPSRKSFLKNWLRANLGCRAMLFIAGRGVLLPPSRSFHAWLSVEERPPDLVGAAVRLRVRETGGAH
jgi:hypothetical protein